MNSPTPVVEWLTALENRLTALESNGVIAELAKIDDRISSLESRPCNCSAASSAASGGTDGCPSTSPQAPAASPAATGPVTAASASASDPVSAAIRDEPKCSVCGGPAGSMGRPPAWYCRDKYCPGYSIEKFAPQPPAPVVKAEPAGETAWDRYQRSLLPSGTLNEETFNRFVAAEVAAAKAKPHAETAEEVADKDLLCRCLRVWKNEFTVLNLPWEPKRGSIGHELEKRVAAIKRERGEA